MQVLVLIVGGFETTSRTLAYISFMLAHNPDVQVLHYYFFGSTVSDSRSIFICYGWIYVIADV